MREYRGPRLNDYYSVADIPMDVVVRFTPEELVEYVNRRDNRERNLKYFLKAEGEKIVLTLRECPKNQWFWIVPWSIIADNEGKLWVDSAYDNPRTEKFGTSELAIMRVDGGYVIDVTKMDEPYRFKVREYVRPFDNYAPVVMALGYIPQPKPTHTLVEIDIAPGIERVEIVVKEEGVQIFRGMVKP